MATDLLDSGVLYWHFLGLPLIGFVVSSLLCVLVYGRGGVGTSSLLIRGIASLAVLATFPMAIDQIGLSIAMSDPQTFTFLSIGGSTLGLLIGVPYVFIPARANAVVVSVSKSISSIGKKSGSGAQINNIDSKHNVTVGQGDPLSQERSPTEASVRVKRGQSNESGVRVSPGDCNVTIGRSGDNTIVIDDQKVSRHHARIVFEQGRYQIEDVDSSNGTFIDGSRVNSRQNLDPEATITVGNAELAFQSAKPGQPSVPGLQIHPEERPMEVAAQQQSPQHTFVRKADRTAIAWLAILDGPDKGKRFDLGDKPVTIGRSSDNAFVIQDQSVSRHHSLLVHRNGKFVLCDAGSSVGTKVNDNLIAKQTLTAGNTLTVGDTDFTLVKFESQAVAQAGPDTRSNTVYGARPQAGVVLVAQTGPNAGNSFPLEEGINRLGRDPVSCTVLLDDESVGRNHCVLQLNEGTVTVHDLGSANGTFINGNRLTGKELTSQDTVTIGGTKMVFIAASSTDSLAA